MKGERGVIDKNIKTHTLIGYYKLEKSFQEIFNHLNLQLVVEQKRHYKIVHPGITYLNIITDNSKESIDRKIERLNKLVGNRSWLSLPRCLVLSDL